MVGHTLHTPRECSLKWNSARAQPPLSHPAVPTPQARLKFPIDYPYSPPAFRFLTKMWHPNIYEVSCMHASHRPLPLRGLTPLVEQAVGALARANLLSPLLRQGTCASPFFTHLLMIPRVGSYPPSGGTPHRTSGEARPTMQVWRHLCPGLALGIHGKRHVCPQCCLWHCAAHPDTRPWGDPKTSCCSPWEPHLEGGLLVLCVPEGSPQSGSSPSPLQLLLPGVCPEV